MSLNDVSCEGEAKSSSGYTVGVARSNPIELFEYSSLIFGGDSDAPVDDLNDGFGFGVIETQVDIPGVARVFHRVRKQIEHSLFQRIAIGQDRKNRRELIFDGDREREPMLSQRLLHRLRGSADDVG